MSLGKNFSDLKAALELQWKKIFIPYVDVTNIRATENLDPDKVFDYLRKSLKKEIKQEKLPLVRDEDRIEYDFGKKFEYEYFESLVSSGDKLTLGLQYIEDCWKKGEKPYDPWEGMPFPKRLYQTYQPSRQYREWEMNALDTAIQNLADDEEFIENYSQMKDRADYETKKDALKQWEIKSFVCQRINDHLAGAFNVVSRPCLLVDVPDDIQIYGVASEKFGLIMLNYSRKHGEGFEADIERNKLDTIGEEVKHMIDMELMRLYKEGSLNKDHPAYDHARVILANSCEYDVPVKDEKGFSTWISVLDYKQQYIERNAKDFRQMFAHRFERMIEKKRKPKALRA
ncbi:MAG: hypothetical protein CMP22_00065 [Rickettsiales bacterium]|nr:hypothetical protein [Rickettsiales bacterium]|tara:strand:- start:313 stop:1338 length:1026 start_codon:yes stop_codon:yes gene_type:complete